MTTTGIIVTVAGGGFPITGNGDGGLATAAKLSSPGDVAVTPDGGFLLVANFGSDEIVAFALDPTTGVPGAIVARVKTPKPTCVRVVFDAL